MRGRPLLISSILFFVVILMMAGCAPVISRSTLDSVEKNLTFSEIIRDPAGHRGAMVLLGGKVIGVENMAETSLIEVLEFPLARNLKPVLKKESEGRFMALFKGFIDPLVYRGRLITVAGELREPLTRPLDRAAYTYPVVDVRERYLWRFGRDNTPAISIGIGLGFSSGGY